MQLNNIHDLVLIRFADVLLMQSELKKDVAGINEVRKRAGLNPIGAYSEEALRNSAVGSWLARVPAGTTFVVGILPLLLLRSRMALLSIIADSLIRILHTMEVILPVTMLQPVSRRCLRLR